MTIVIGFLWSLLFISMIVLMGVILLQEGKGGGLAEAFGGVGAETFGVKAAGINKFTALVATIFLGLCIVLTLLKAKPDDRLIAPELAPKDQAQQFDPRGMVPPGPPDDPGGNGGAQDDQGKKPDDEGK